MTHTFTSDLSLSNLNSASITYYAFISYSFIFTTMTLPVLCRSENSFTEKTVPFGFKCSVVYRFRFFYFTMTPFTYFLRRSQADLYRIKYYALLCILLHLTFSFLSLRRHSYCHCPQSHQIRSLPLRLFRISYLWRH